MKKFLLAITFLLILPGALACVELRPQKIFVIQDSDQILSFEIENTCDKILRNVRVTSPFLGISRELPALPQNDTLLLVVRVPEGHYNATTIFEYNNQTSIKFVEIVSTNEKRVDELVQEKISFVKQGLDKVNASKKNLFWKPKQEWIDKLAETSHSIELAESELASQKYFQSQLILARAENELQKLEQNIFLENVYRIVLTVLASIFFGVIPLSFLISKKFFNYTFKPTMILDFMKLKFLRIRFKKMVLRFKARFANQKRKLRIKMSSYFRRPPRRSRSK